MFHDHQVSFSDLVFPHTPLSHAYYVPGLWEGSLYVNLVELMSAWDMGKHEVGVRRSWLQSSFSLWPGYLGTNFYQAGTTENEVEPLALLNFRKYFHYRKSPYPELNLV